MNIEYRQGDVTKASETVIIHGCNAKGVMGSGVAKTIRNVYPGCYDVYRLTSDMGGLFLGKIIWWTSDDLTRVIGNCITQATYGRSGELFVDYDAIRSCMMLLDQKAKDSADETDIYSRIAMPKIGAGLGGGDWNIIAEIIEDTSTAFQPVVYEYEP